MGARPLLWAPLDVHLLPKSALAVLRHPFRTFATVAEAENTPKNNPFFLSGPALIWCLPYALWSSPSGPPPLEIATIIITEQLCFIDDDPIIPAVGAQSMTSWASCAVANDEEGRKSFFLRPCAGSAQNFPPALSHPCPSKSFRLALLYHLELNTHPIATLTEPHQHRIV